MAASLEDVAEVAVCMHLPRLAQRAVPIVQMCGPMTTGGVGSLEGNMRRFNRAIAFAADEGHLVFDQIPLQQAIIRITDHHTSKQYNTDILDVLYASIFGCGHVSIAYFLPGWETSFGARWERERVAKHGIEIREAPLKWVIEQN